MGRAPSVLVVDDDDDVRELSAALLERAGFRVATAIDGLDALDVLDRIARPDVIMVDLMMPRMDGWELIAALRAQPSRASIPVIAVSAAYDPRRRCLGGARVLQKPFCADQLVAAVAACSRAELGSVTP